MPNCPDAGLFLLHSSLRPILHSLAVKSEPPPAVVSSDQFSTGQFRPHGRVEIWAEDSAAGTIVYAIAQGPFNAEFVKVFQMVRADLFRSRPISKIYGNVVQLHTSILSSPDTLETYANFLGTLASDPAAPAATAWVVAPEVEGREFMLPLFERLFVQSGHRFKAFESLSEAQSWITAIIAPAA